MKTKLVPTLAALDLTQVSDYAVGARYNLEFWPNREALTEALVLTEKVHRIVLKTLLPCEP